MAASKLRFGMLLSRTNVHFRPLISLKHYSSLRRRSYRLCEDYQYFARCFATKPESKFKSTGKRAVFLGLFVCGTLSVGFELYNRYLNHNRMKNIQATPSLNETYSDPGKIDVKASKRIIGTNVALSELKIQLFQYQTCPFCCKVRAYLDYYGLNYDVIEVNPVLRKELKFSKYRKVPILLYNYMNDNRQLNDSTVIISILASFMRNKSYSDINSVLKFYPPVTYVNPEGKSITEGMNKYNIMYEQEKLSEKEMETVKEERKWRMWADSWLVHLLSPNIYCTREQALQAFNYFSEVGEWEKNFSTWERYLVIYVGALAMYFIGKRLKKKYNLKEDVRQSLYDACNDWTRAIGKKRKFMGGDKPNLADLAVYGVLSSIEGCNAFQDLLQNTKIDKWYYLTKEAVSNHLGAVTT